MDQIWFGYGYDGFWGATSRRVIEIARDKTVGFTPHYSHNGLIELLLDVGIFGVPLFVLHLIRAIRGSLTTTAFHAARLLGAGALVLTLAFLLFNITESSILGGSSVNWMTFVAVTTKLSILLRTSKRTTKYRSPQPPPAFRASIGLTGQNRAGQP